MMDPLHIPGLTGPKPVAGDRDGGGSAAPDVAAAERGARFQMLLEDLDSRARALSQSAEAPLSAESLPEALESARSSLEGALQLSQDLLEAVRQSSAHAAAKQSLKP
jgi:hypothetical protein